MTDTPRCCTLVPRSDGWRTRYVPCKRAGVVEHGGKLYCRQHDPAARERRFQATSERWAEESRERNRQAEIIRAEREVVTRARLVCRQETSWDAVAEAVSALERLHGPDPRA